MAKIAQRILEKEEHDADGDLIRPLIIRFCGISELSSNGLSLLQSICHQIKYLYRYEDISVPNIYQEACDCFHDLINRHPVILMIDSIDQLTDTYFERSKLSFLESINPNTHTRIIVSCLADEKDPETGKWLYCFGCDTRLAEAEVPRLRVHLFSEGQEVSKSDSHARYIIERMLLKAHRTLTPQQWMYVMENVAVEPTALYARLTVRTVAEWHSADTSNHLKGRVHGLVNQILECMEREFGRLLTRSALGFITFSVGGIRNDEMEGKYL